MTAPHSAEKLFLRDEGQRARASGLPPDIVAQSARRLRILALVYAGVFFLSGFFPALLSPSDRSHLFSSVRFWAPGVTAIGVALVVAALTTRPSIPLRVVMLVGLGFEVAGSFGIAAAEFLDPATIDFNTRWLGFSWVAIWTLFFTVVVPRPPRQTLAAALASVSSVPLVIGFVVATNPVPDVTAWKFFFGLVFPYLLVAMMAYVAARVIHALGQEVTRASWAATAWWSASARAGWVRCGGPSITCWRARRRSSWCVRTRSGPSTSSVISRCSSASGARRRPRQ